MFLLLLHLSLEMSFTAGTSPMRFYNIPKGNSGAITIFTEDIHIDQSDTNNYPVKFYIIPRGTTDTNPAYRDSNLTLNYSLSTKSQKLYINFDYSFINKNERGKSYDIVVSAFLGDDVVYSNTITITYLEKILDLNLTMFPYYIPLNSDPKFSVRYRDINYGAQTNVYGHIDTEDFEQTSLLYDEDYYRLTNIQIENNDDYYYFNYPEDKYSPLDTTTDEVGNYTLYIAAMESDIRATAAYITFPFYVRTPIDISLLSTDKQFYQAGEIAILTFSCSHEQEPDTPYYAYAGDVRKDITGTNGPFTIEYVIPSAADHNHSFSYMVTIADQINSTEYTGYLHVVVAPALDNIQSDKTTYTVDDDMTITVRCNDTDTNDEFNVSYRVGDTGDFTYYNVQQSTGDETTLTVSPEKSLLKVGTNKIFVKVTDKYGLESNPVSIDVLILERPQITIEPITKIYKPNEDATIKVSITDHDENDNVILKYTYESLSGYQDSDNFATFSDSNSVITKDITIKLPSEYSGNLAVTFKAIDSHSLESSPVIVNIAIQNSPVILNASSTKETVLKGETLTIQGFVSDIDQNEQITVVSNGADVKTYNADATVTKFEFQIDTTQLNLGQNTATISIRDKSNFTSASIDVVYYLRSKPVINFISADQGKIVRNKEMTVEYQIKDDDDQDHSTLKGTFGKQSFTETQNIDTTSDYVTHILKFNLTDDIDAGENSITLVATDSYGFESAQAETKFYVLSPPGIKFIQNGTQDVYKQGDTVPLKVQISDIDGDKNISIKITDENGTVVAEKSMACSLDNGVSSCNSKEVTFDIEIPRNKSNGNYKYNAEVSDSYNQSSDDVDEIKVFNYPPELNVSYDTVISAAQNTSVNITYKLKDLNTNDSSHIYVTYKLNETSNETENETFEFSTTTDWKEHNFTFFVPENAKDGIEFVVYLQAVDENGAKSDLKNVTIKADSKTGTSNAIAGKGNGFWTINENKWIILVIGAAVVIAILIIILILLIFTYNKKEEVIAAIPLAEEEDTYFSDSGETISISTGDMIIPEIVPDVSDSGETFEVSSEDISFDKL